MIVLPVVSFFLFAYACVGLFYGELKIMGLHLHTGSMWIYTAIASAVLFLVSAKHMHQVGRQLLLSCSGVFFALLLASDLSHRRFVFWSGSTFRVEYLLVVLVLGLVLSRTVTTAKSDRAWLALLFISQAFLITVFLQAADGRLIFSDDHPSFLYRLALLKEYFPAIPFYNTDWNAGYSAREFFPSGVLNVFFLVAPFLYFGPDITQYENAWFYTYLLPYVYFFLMPWGVYFAARVFGLSRAGAIFAGVLALGPSTGYFEWLLKYGTLGFSLSAGVSVLTAALSARLALLEEEASWKSVFCLLLVSFFSLAWSLSFVTLLPVLAIAIWHYRKLLEAARAKKILTFAVLFALVNGPWIMIFIQESQVASFVGGSALPGAAETQHSVSFDEGLKHFRSYIQKVNPLLLVSFFPGLFLLSSKLSRVVVGGTIFWLLFLGATGEYLKPQLELRRMIIPAAFFMCIPAGALLGFAFARAKEMLPLGRLASLSGLRMPRALGLLASLLLLAAALLSPFQVASVLANRTEEQYNFAKPEVGQFIEAVKSVDQGPGRIFFLGFVLQEFNASHYSAQNGGHLAPLPLFTGKQMYASDYYHRHWSEVDPIPLSYRSRGEEGIEEFLSLTNATSVITLTRIWANYCLNNPAYEQKFQVGRFRFFRRKYQEESYFLEGDGEVKIERNAIYVKPEALESVLKFRYFPRVHVASGELGVVLEPVEVFIEEAGPNKKKPVHFIKLSVPKDLLEKKWIRISY